MNVRIPQKLVGAIRSLSQHSRDFGSVDDPDLIPLPRRPRREPDVFLFRHPEASRDAGKHQLFLIRELRVPANFRKVRVVDDWFVVKVLSGKESQEDFKVVFQFRTGWE